MPETHLHEEDCPAAVHLLRSLCGRTSPPAGYRRTDTGVAVDWAALDRSYLSTTEKGAVLIAHGTGSPTVEAVLEQLQTHGLEFGGRYRDPASGFEGELAALYFYKHGCLRVNLRGQNRTTGEPAEFTFDAPELVAVDTGEQVPAGRRTGGPHDLAPVARPGSVVQR